MLERQSLQDLLDRIGAATPSPGSGAAAAAGLAIGIACLRKAIAVSLKSQKNLADLHAAQQRLVALADQALAVATADERGFPQLLAADKKGQHAERSAAAEDLVALGKRFQALCRAVEMEANDLDDLVDPIMANDLLAARLLSRAAATIAKANAAENATLI